MRAILAVLLALGGVVIGVGPASAAGPCSLITTRTTAGGHEAQLQCSNPIAFIDGFGSTIGDANREGLLLRQFSVNGGPTCSGSSTNTATGGYEAHLTCNGPISFVNAFGTTLTDAAREARLLTEMAPRGGCTHDSVRAVRGGYEVAASCTNPIIFFDGIGSTVTEAAENARLASGIG